MVGKLLVGCGWGCFVLFCVLVCCIVCCVVFCVTLFFVFICVMLFWAAARSMSLTVVSLPVPVCRAFPLLRRVCDEFVNESCLSRLCAISLLDM